MKVAVLGGTGKEGRGLARRMASAGITVSIGSRAEERAKQMAETISQQTGQTVVGHSNWLAAEQADVVFLCVPFGAHQTTLIEIAGVLHGKIVVDVAVPLAAGAPTRYGPPPEGSALGQAQAILEGVCPVVGAFQSIASHSMNADGPLDSDVFILGDDQEAKQTVMELVRRIGAVPVDAGGSEYAPTIEALTPWLIGRNKHYKRPGMGLRLTGLPEEGG